MSTKDDANVMVDEVSAYSASPPEAARLMLESLSPREREELARRFHAGRMEGEPDAS